MFKVSIILKHQKMKLQKQKQETKLRVGNNVKIIHSAKKSFINKTGKIISRKKDDFFPDTDIFLISIPYKERAIWQYGSELELIKS